MTQYRGFLLLAAIFAFTLPDFAAAQRNREYRGAPNDIGFISPSRGWNMGPTNGSHSVRRGHGAHFSSHRSFGFGSWNFYGGVYGWPAYGVNCCPYCGGFGCSGWCFGGPFWIPSVIVSDSSQRYGPQGIRNFLGIANAAPAPAVRAAPAAVAEAPVMAPAVNLPPRANATARERAIKFLQYGDRHFQEGRYRQALSRYKLAGASASDMAEIEFRKAFAELMMGDFSDAALAVRRGMTKTANWPESDFAVDDLFLPAAKAEAFHLLQERLQETDFDADAHFMLGVMLHFDGHLEAAQAHFLRTIELLGQAEHARVFLTEQPEARDAAAVGK